MQLGYQKRVEAVSEHKECRTEYHLFYITFLFMMVPISTTHCTIKVPRLHYVDAWRTTVGLYK